MHTKILIRFSELTTKGKNRMTFIKKLEGNFFYNISKSLIIDFKKDYDKFEIIFDKKNLEIIEEKISHLTGISKYLIVEEILKIDDLKSMLIKHYKNNLGTFKIIPLTREKGLIESSDKFKREIAEELLRNTDMKVDIKNPKNQITIEIFNNRFLWHKKTVSINHGLPSGINGRGLSLLSGGIDSPVASNMIINRGLHVDFITFLTPPKTTKAAELKIQKIAKQLSKYNGSKTTLYIVNCFELMKNIKINIEDERYRITLFRRSFMRMATQILEKYNYDVLITGDALGQVASQTIESLNCIDDASKYLTLRPLIGFSKNDIINLAKKINTYELSIIAEEDSCSSFAPDRPVTKPKLEKVLKLELKIKENINIENDIIKTSIRVVELNDN